jgi:hypothetical protein
MIPEQHAEARRENLAQAGELSRTFAMLLEALNRHRGKGQQAPRFLMDPIACANRSGPGADLASLPYAPRLKGCFRSRRLSCRRQR